MRLKKPLELGISEWRRRGGEGSEGNIWLQWQIRGLKSFPGVADGSKGAGGKWSLYWDEQWGLLFAIGFASFEILFSPDLEAAAVAVAANTYLTLLVWTVQNLRWIIKQSLILSSTLFHISIHILGCSLFGKHHRSHYSYIKILWCKVQIFSLIIFLVNLNKFWDQQHWTQHVKKRITIQHFRGTWSAAI